MKVLEALTDIEQKDIDYVFMVAREAIDLELEEGGESMREPIRIEIDPPNNSVGFSKAFTQKISQFEHRNYILSPSLVENCIVYIRKGSE